MAEPLEEDLTESLAPESTAGSPDDSDTDDQEDNWQNQDEEDVDDQTDPRKAEKTAQRMSSQTDHKGSESTACQTSDQADLRVSDHSIVAQPSESDQKDHRMYEQTQSRTSSQANLLQSEETDSQMFLPQRTEQTEHRRPSHAADRDHGQIDQRMSNQTEPRAYEQSNRRLSVSSEQGGLEEIGHRMASQAGNRTSEQTENRLSGLVEQRTSAKFGHRPASQVDPVTSLKTHQEVYEEAAEQADHSAHHLPVDNADYSDQMDHLMPEEDYYKDYIADYAATGQYDDRIFAQFGNIKEYKEAEARIEPCEFETRGTTGDNSPVSVETDTESATDMQAFDSFGDRFTGSLQAKDQVYSQRFPCISSKLDYIIGQEKTEAIETKPDDIPEQEGRKSFGYDQTCRRQFPPIVYEDPYQVSLRYMEKHHILQIFQITENLVYEKPEDPLSFMLYQVQEMIENRDKKK